MRFITAVAAAVLGVVVLHDMGAEPCDRWYRIPLQIGCDLGLPDLPFGHPVYELAYGTSDPQELHGFYLSDPWSYRDPTRHKDSTWDDVQSGTFTVIPSLDLILVMPPSWLDKKKFMQSFLEMNPAAVPISAASKPLPFILVQMGGGVEGIQIQILLDATGKVTTWKRSGQWSDGTDHLRRSGDAVLPRALVSELFEAASGMPTQGGARIYWNCQMFDGGVRSLTTSDGNTISRSHWVNNRWPSKSTRVIFEALLDAGIPPGER